MSSHQEGPNPLRPYYIPPSIPEIKPTATTFEIDSKNAKYALSPRDIFSDIDYSNYVSEGSQSILGNVRNLLDDSLYKYIGVLVAQPFEVAKTILQVKSQASGNGTLTPIDEDKLREKSRRPGDSMYTDVSMIS
jgi:mitochondrial fusion and transport protein UGO1